MVLLAKSGDETDTRRWLVTHTRDVMAAAEALFGAADGPTRLGERWLRFFDLPPTAWWQFQRTLAAACGLHDWGKANDGFQKAVRNRGEQAIWHEHFSALLVAHEVCWKWLGKIPDVDREVILSAVLTHHLRANGQEDWGGKPLASGTVIRLEERDGSFRDVVEEVAGQLGVDPFPVASMPEQWTAGGRPIDVWKHRKCVGDDILGRLRAVLRRPNEGGRRKLLQAVRAALIAADAAGSGLVRTGRSVVDWVAENVSRRELVTADTVNRLIADRVGQVEREKKQQFTWNRFQTDCDALPDRALLLAPCGSGKTLAAWRWIAARLRDRPVGHVLFLYPTRATAREGFKDYVSWAPEGDAALMHGTSGFDLDGMFANAAEGDDRKGRDYEVERRLFSLGYWPRRVFSATVDQFLAFMQYGYGPVCMLPVLADSVVVIDEVHSFDNNMFAALKDFLTNFHVPVLCMTATLPTNRRDELVACGLTPPPARPDDLVEVAKLPRYRLCRVAARCEAEAEVRKALAAGKRVLWVVNQVKRAHQVVARFVGRLPANVDLRTPEGIPVICYHSRFKLTDRVSRHADTMRALKRDEAGDRAALGVTTQVCEMSLDIDVDLLVTEDCPVTSLVQRMGRCNRDRKARPLDRSGEVLVYPPDDGDNLPYSDNDLAGLAEFLSLTAAEPSLSQVRLEELMLSVPCPELPGDPLSRFLTSGPYAVGGDDEGDGFREGNDFNRPCVLPGDVMEFLKPDPDGKRRPGFVLPVPRRLGRCRVDGHPEHNQLPGHLGVTADGHYHPAVGFCDEPVSQWGVE